MHLCDKVSHLIVSAASPVSLTACLHRTAPKKSLSDYFPYLSLLNDLSMQLSGLFPGLEQSISFFGREGRSITRRLDKLQLWRGAAVTCHAPISRETRT